MNIQLFIIPITLILLGVLLKFKPFHKIGGNGYSSPFSKKSQETWLFAQQVAPKVILKNGLILFLITIVFSMFHTVVNININNLKEIIYTINFIFLIITYGLIESKLRKKIPNL
ncbi:Uncharacterised protein [[Clostridium] sordellii]|uniref:SdpI family protein n=1 Tax=Paraclostridium sordellii TaxID=1505 RepID=UPI0005DD5E78|nr:Uncharacterised protein [[Clostridium] sordellii] [Paeniclostridium sordellii]CEP93347.1 Uncharacterised protein [[Clostridium] sordellii] [Paeniclostridium sordellii]